MLVLHIHSRTVHDLVDAPSQISPGGASNLITMEEPSLAERHSSSLKRHVQLFAVESRLLCGYPVSYQLIVGKNVLAIAEQLETSYSIHVVLGEA